MTEAFRGQGTQFQISTLESGSVDGDYTTVAELRTTTFPARADELDASNHDTPDAWKEWVEYN